MSISERHVTVNWVLPLDSDSGQRATRRPLSRRSGNLRLPGAHRENRPPRYPCKDRVDDRQA